jgi:hypothetical protein
MTPVTRNAAMQAKDSPPSPATFPSLHDTPMSNSHLRCPLNVQLDIGNENRHLGRETVLD